jgi:hypothetical protein
VTIGCIRIKDPTTSAGDRFVWLAGSGSFPFPLIIALGTGEKMLLVGNAAYEKKRMSVDFLLSHCPPEQQCSPGALVPLNVTGLHD